MVKFSCYHNGKQVIYISIFWPFSKRFHNGHSIPQASHIKSFAHDHPRAPRKYFLIYHMRFDYCLQTQEKNKSNKKTFNCDKQYYFLVLDYLEFWLNLIIFSMLVSDSMQVWNLRNREPQTRWPSVNARLDTFSFNFPVNW